MSLVERLDAKFYNAAYTSRKALNGTLLLKEMIRRHLAPGKRVLDIGAGAGHDYNHDYRSLGVEVTGIDVSAEVLTNPHLDRAYVSDGANMPFVDGEFDLVISDFVFEHVPDPEALLREASRVVKLGGFLFLRTPNKWHYIPVMARALPLRLHPFLLRKLTARVAEDCFPVLYKCNSKGELIEACERVGFRVSEVHMVEGEPSYLQRLPALYGLGVLYERIANSTERLSFMRSNILIEARKGGV